MESDKTVSQSLLDLQDRLNNVLFTMDFYRQAVDTIIGSAETGPLSTERQRNGLALYGDWIVDNIESIEQSIDKLRQEIETAAGEDANKTDNSNLRENAAQYYLVGKTA